MSVATSERVIHDVGTWSKECPDEETAIRTRLQEAAPYYRSLSDGEPGVRSDWIVRILRDLAGDDGGEPHPDLEVKIHGDFADYDDMRAYRVKEGHDFRCEHLRLQFYKDAKASWEKFDALRHEFDRPDLDFQVGIPGAFDLSIFTFNDFRLGLRHTPTYLEALGKQTADIFYDESIGGKPGPDKQVVFQLELPAEIAGPERSLVSGKDIKLPQVVRNRMAVSLAKRSLEQVKMMPTYSRLIAHECDGRYKDKAYAFPNDLTTAVVFTNTLIANWPRGRKLEAVHIPMTAAELPPPTNAKFYEPLAKLALGAMPDLRIIAGFVHNSQPRDDQYKIQEIVDYYLRKAKGNPNYKAGVAASCGYGSKSEAVALSSLRKSVAYAQR